MYRTFVRKNINLVSIVVFLFLFTLVVLMKPAFLFNTDGSFRNFGIGYKNKTVVPIWLVAIILAILAYFSVLYFLVSPKLNNF
jgi:hypothetical protein